MWDNIDGTLSGLILVIARLRIMAINLCNYFTLKTCRLIGGQQSWIDYGDFKVVLALNSLIIMNMVVGVCFVCHCLVTKLCRGS